jgi:hypothetical protein
VIGDLIREAVAAYERGGFEAAFSFAQADSRGLEPPVGGRLGGAALPDHGHREVGPDRAVEAILVTTTGRSSGVTTEMSAVGFRPAVANVDNARAERPRLDELQVEPLSEWREVRSAASQHDGADELPVLVDEV